MCFEKILAFIFSLHSSYVMIDDAISIVIFVISVVIFVHFCRYFCSFLSLFFSFLSLFRGQQYNYNVCFEKIWIWALKVNFTLHSSHVIFLLVFPANKIHNVFEMHCAQLCRSSCRNGVQA